MSQSFIPIVLKEIGANTVLILVITHMSTYVLLKLLKT